MGTIAFLLRRMSKNNPSTTGELFLQMAKLALLGMHLAFRQRPPIPQPEQSARTT